MAFRDRLVDSVTWLIALIVLGFLSGFVLARKGNLAWDDADYLRRGLTNARLAESTGTAWVLPRAIGLLQLERPKPPWLVGWIEFGALVLGRRHLDLLILHSTILPFAILLIAGGSKIGRWLDGPAGGLLAIICLISSPYSLIFGAKVMVETYLALWVLLTYALASLLAIEAVALKWDRLGDRDRSLPAHEADRRPVPPRPIALLAGECIPSDCGPPTLAQAASVVRRGLHRRGWSLVRAEYRLDSEIRAFLFEIQRACRTAIGPHPDCAPCENDGR